ncbi:MAG: nucleotidyltransferase domain-containing protein [Oscillospiraceae bacterium]|nr:nucleotidyltransferase domain-containing protein [Oscillospiraceae bacterium]
MNAEILKIKDGILSAVNVEKLYLFGSYTNGTPNEDSDYDFYIVIPDIQIPSNTGFDVYYTPVNNIFLSPLRAGGRHLPRLRRHSRKRRLLNIRKPSPAR